MKLGMEVSCPFWRHRRVMRKILTQNFIENFRESLRANSVKTGATALVQGCRGVGTVAELCGSRGFLDGHALHDASNNFDARKNKSCVLYLRAKERLSWKTRDKSPGTLEVWRAGAADNAKIASAKIARAKIARGSIGIFNGVFYSWRPNYAAAYRGCRNITVGSGGDYAAVPASGGRSDVRSVVRSDVRVWLFAAQPDPQRQTDRLSRCGR